MTDASVTPRGNAAILYVRDAYSVDRADLKGRHAAGAGFLRAVARYLEAPSLYCYARTKDDFNQFAAEVWQYSPRREVRWIDHARLRQTAEVGALHIADPMLADWSWHRARHGEHLYSLTGITHSICSTNVLEGFAKAFMAPIMPWDAIICTSRAARGVIEQVHQDWTERRRGWGHREAPPMPQLPIIPLGVEVGNFDPAGAPEMRARMRAEFDMRDDDVCFLFFGRLSYHAKSHFVPMLQALEMAAQRTKKRLFLIMAGRFPGEAVELQVRRAMATFAPSVRVAVVDGRDDERCQQSWHAADIFTSLSDNLQETFGLTVIEAMAAGLPVVASDWDGYRDTVAHGESGILIPTWQPPVGAGVELAARYSSDELTYDRYIGYASLCTPVDVGLCAESYLQLVENPDRRRRLGEAGRRRARERFDWKVVIGQYSDLWAELRARREHACANGFQPLPSLTDPFKTYAGFSSRQLAPETRLGMAGGIDGEAQVTLVLNLEMNSFGLPTITNEAELKEIVAQLKDGPLTLAELSVGKAGEAQASRQRACAFLLKFGVLTVVSEE